MSVPEFHDSIRKLYETWVFPAWFKSFERRPHSKKGNPVVSAATINFVWNSANEKIVVKPSHPRDRLSGWERQTRQQSKITGPAHNFHLEKPCPIRFQLARCSAWLRGWTSKRLIRQADKRQPLLLFINRISRQQLNLQRWRVTHIRLPWLPQNQPDWCCCFSWWCNESIIPTCN